MQALILVGGRGTRLLPLTESLPKPVLPLAGQPFLLYVLEWLVRHGVDRAVLACGFRPDPIREVLGDGGGSLPRLTWVVEPEPLGTAGAMRHALGELDQRFLAMNGDLLTDFDLSALIAFHEERATRATIGLKQVEQAASFGLVDLAGDGAVTGFSEKPPGGSDRTGPALVNAGTYVLERSVIEELPAMTAVSIEREVFPRLAGGDLSGLVLDGYWMDIGTPERYLQATWDVLEGRMTTSLEPIPGAVLVSGDATVAADATIGPRAVVSAGARVGAGAEVLDSVLLEGAEVPDGATVRDSILGFGANVAEGERVEGEVRGRATLGQNPVRDAR